MMKVSWLKDIILAALVGLSLVFSYELWAGIWHNSVEVGFSEPATLRASANPRIKDLTAPTLVTLISKSPQVYSVAGPGSDIYNLSSKLLGSMVLTDFHEEFSNTWSQEAITTVRFDFGLDLSRQLLSYWLPGLPQSVLAAGAKSITLYELPGQQVVWIDLSSDYNEYYAQTNLPLDTLRQLLKQAATQPAWTTWNPADNSSVPANPLKMTMSLWKTGSMSVSPLVRSFFVNPLALTRIQESPHTVVWTDGSRVAQWDETGNTLTYQDPNATGTIRATPALQVAAMFMRNHGGAPASTIALDNSLFSPDGGLDYTLASYVGGYPILHTSGEFQINVFDSRVTLYRTPLTTLLSTIKRKQVTVMAKAQLEAVVKKLMPATPPELLDVQLGWREVSAPGGSEAWLKPVYVISQSGMFLEAVDAVTGRVIKGMSAQ